ncbi:MAG: hypothetical protein ASARMPREDX12_004455 [Alectoria sarmentosa]|nr:MAG: hypothetical protein ASARMPREDX12_004455 [Alectoria sarmentosa]CAD6565588.1 MAG: hypothetical protein ASARMPRED_007351 [Alectoria sarmentosa]
MSNCVVPKRNVVFSFAEFQKYPTTTDIYAMTLPFSEKDACLSLKMEVIKRTKERWIWFSTARQLDDKLGERLGTLVYFPQEIRDRIFLLVIDCHFDDLERRYCLGGASPRRCHRLETDAPARWRLDYQAASYRTAPTNLGVFELRSYHCCWDYCPFNPRMIMSLRLASPSTKVDFEYLFLRCTIFKFNCPRMLDRFLDQLSPFQQSLLQHLTIDILGDCSCCTNNESYRGWMTVCTHLPLSLKSVTFDLGREAHGGHHRRGTLPRWSYHGDFHIRGREEIKGIEKAAELVEVLSKRLVRWIPKIHIAMTGVDHTDDFGQRQLLQVDHDLLSAAMGELEQ